MKVATRTSRHASGRRRQRSSRTETGRRKRWTKDHINPDFGLAIASRRQDLGMSQEELGDAVGLSQCAVSYLESPRRRTFPKPETFWALYDALEFDPEIDPPEVFLWAFYYELRGA